MYNIEYLQNQNGCLINKHKKPVKIAKLYLSKVSKGAQINRYNQVPNLTKQDFVNAHWWCPLLFCGVSCLCICVLLIAGLLFLTFKMHYFYDVMQLCRFYCILVDKYNFRYLQY